MDTRILFQASVSQLPHEWIRLGQCLAEIYIRNSRVMDATMILEVVWRNRYLHGITFLEALSPGLKLAALLEQGKRLDDAARILEVIWQERTSNREIPIDALKPGMQLAAIHTTTGRLEDARKILEAIWSSPYSWSEDIAKAGNQLAAVYMTEKRRSGALEIWELVWKYWTQNGTVSCREFDVADQLAVMYKDDGRLCDAKEVRINLQMRSSYS